MSDGSEKPLDRSRKPRKTTSGTEGAERDVDDSSETSEQESMGEPRIEEEHAPESQASTSRLTGESGKSKRQVPAESGASNRPTLVERMRFRRSLRKPR